MGCVYPEVGAVFECCVSLNDDLVSLSCEILEVVLVSVDFKLYLFQGSKRQLYMARSGQSPLQ